MFSDQIIVKNYKLQWINECINQWTVDIEIKL